MREGYLESRGVAYLANEFVSGRPTLLLIHGFGASASQWMGCVEGWEEKYNLLIPDLRGHGRSKHWSKAEEYAPEHMADDLLALIDDLKIEQCAVAGYSLGTYVALAMYLRQPARTQKLILVSPLYQFSTLWKVRLTRPLFSALAFVTRVLPADAPHDRVDYAAWAKAGDENAGRVWADFRHTGARSYFYNLKDIEGFSEDEAWRKVACPTLIVYGARDDFMPQARAEALARAIPNAKLRILTNADHLMLVNDSGEVAYAIEQFV